jgi:hypothetical protein
MTCGGVVSALSLWLVQVPRHYWEFEKVGTLCAADDSLKWTVLWTLDRRHWSKRMIGNEVVSSAGASEQRTKEPPSRPGGSMVFGEPQLPAVRYCSSTEAGTRPRLESSMPLEAAQARTALRSTPELALRLVERFPLTLRALLM